MTLVLIMRGFFFLIIVAGIALAAYRIYGLGLFNTTSQSSYSYDRSDSPQTKKRSVKRSLVLPILVMVFGLVGFATWTSATYVSAREGAIVEIQATGKLYRLEKGLHVFPFDLRMVPILARTEKYSLSNQADGSNSITLGSEDKTNRVESSSSSPGNPSVSFWARAVAVPDANQLLTLYRLYGSNYIDGYVRSNFESALKTVQGRNVFNYVANNRAEFEEAVMAELERRLSLETNGIPLVDVKFVNIIDYSYSDDLEKQLNDIVTAANETSAATERVLKAKQEALAVEAKATGEKNAAISKAEGEKEASRLAAEAAAYAKKQEALGITDIQNALSSSPTYLQLQTIQKWSGVLPQFIGGDAPVPFINVPVASQTPVTSP